MRIQHALLALSLCAAPSVRAAAQDESSHVAPVPAPDAVADPMASFARLVPGEWRVTLNDETVGLSTWHWGPGQHSIRRAGVVDVYYWHPAREQVCTLALDPFARGVAEGTIQFDGETAENVFDLYQTSGHRKLVMRWAFDGPDKYHEALFEPTGTGTGLVPMSAWDHVRSPTRTAPRAPTPEEAPKPSERLKALEALLGPTWEAKGKWATGEAFHVQTVFQLIAGVDGIYASTLAPTHDGERLNLLDAYLYHHTGTGALRCLALSQRGGVYEGDVTVVEGGALELHLKGYEGDRVVSHVVRFDFEGDGTLRNRIWSLAGTQRALLLDVHHAQLAPTKD